MTWIAVPVILFIIQQYIKHAVTKVNAFVSERNNTKVSEFNTI